MPLAPHMLQEVSPGVEGVLFVQDRQVGQMQTPNGSVQFLEVLPLTTDEYRLCGRWDANALRGELARENPALLWRVGRTGILSGVRREEILARAQREGSSQEVDFTSELTWDERGIVLDGLNRSVVQKFLTYRIAYGRPTHLYSEDKVVHLILGRYQLSVHEREVTLSTPPDDALQLAKRLADATEGQTVVVGDRR